MDTTTILLDELIDYAGLFPPAKLELSPAVETFARHRGGPLASALGRFVIPVGRLGEFESAAAPHLPPVPAVDDPDQAPDLWGLSVLVSSADELEAVRADLEAIEAFNDRHTMVGAGAAIVDTIELRGSTAEAVDAVLDLLDDELYPYFELDHRTDVRGILAAIAGLDAGAKVRTGGLTPEDHPTIEQLAGFIDACRMADVPFKATAGLHHPVRAHQDSVGTSQFGFLNVFVGAILRYGDAIDATTLREVLAEGDAAAFECRSEGVGWRGRCVSLETMGEARSRFSHSYGSCSFDEPTDELRALGWPVPAVEHGA